VKLAVKSLADTACSRLMLYNAINRRERMTKSEKTLDPAFIEAKRRELSALRESLKKAAGTTETEEGILKDASALQAREYEDDAQKLDTLEKEGLLVSRSVDRLAQIDRALEKIKAGTYGYSDISGDPIGEERLNAVPEATTTFREQENSERKG
jgi:DnaK suppressor protein